MKIESKILVYVNEDCKVDSRGVRIRKIYLIYCLLYGRLNQKICHQLSLIKMK